MEDSKKAHPGAFCTLGDVGTSKAGTPMVCSVRVEGVGERPRWRRDPNAPAPVRRARGTGRRASAPRGSRPTDDVQQAPLVDAPAPVARPEPAPATPPPTPEPTKEPAVSPDGPPLDLSKTSDKPLSQNMWGAGPHHPVSYHPDGPWGNAVDRLGPARRLDYDGVPLAEHLNRVATDVIRGDRTTNDAIGELRRVCRRLPVDSPPRRVLDGLLREVDYPMTPLPEIPEGTHPAVAKMIRDIHSVPAARRDPSLELEPALAIARQMAARPNRNPRMWAFDLQRDCYNRRHESTGVEGKWDIDTAVRTAMAELDKPRRS